jgi:hypothetical protein
MPRTVSSHWILLKQILFWNINYFATFIILRLGLLQIVVHFTRYISVLVKVGVYGKIFWIYINNKKYVLFRRRTFIRTLLILQRLYSEAYVNRHNRSRLLLNSIFQGTRGRSIETNNKLKILIQEFHLSWSDSRESHSMLERKDLSFFFPDVYPVRLGTSIFVLPLQFILCLQN